MPNIIPQQSDLAIVNDCRVIDLFCGIGGLTHGFVTESFAIAPTRTLGTHIGSAVPPVIAQKY